MEYTKAGIVKGEKEGSIRTFQISDNSVDRDNDVIVLENMNLTEFRKNPIIMYLHSANRNPDPDLVIGMAPKIWYEDGKTRLLSKAKFDVDGEGDVNNALAKKVLYKYDEGYLNMASIGFGVDWESAGFGKKDQGEKENVWYWRKSELHEWSSVPVPSNRNARIQRSFEHSVLQNVEQWRNFIDTEGLKGNDLDHFIKNGLKGAPDLMFLDDAFYREPDHITFHFVKEAPKTQPKSNHLGHAHRKTLIQNQILKIS